MEKTPTQPNPTDTPVILKISFHKQTNSKRRPHYYEAFVEIINQQGQQLYTAQMFLRHELAGEFKDLIRHLFWKGIWLKTRKKPNWEYIFTPDFVIYRKQLA